MVSKWLYQQHLKWHKIVRSLKILITRWHGDSKQNLDGLIQWLIQANNIPHKGITNRSIKYPSKYRSDVPKKRHELISHSSHGSSLWRILFIKQDKSPFSAVFQDSGHAIITPKSTPPWSAFVTCKKSFFREWTIKC